VGVGGSEKAAGFVAGAESRGLGKKSFDRTNRQAFQRRDAAAGMRYRHLALRTVERVRQLHFRNDHLRHLAMIQRPCESPPRVRTENDMQDHFLKLRIRRMPVRLPVSRLGIQLQRACPQLTVDLDRRL